MAFTCIVSACGKCNLWQNALHAASEAHECGAIDLIHYAALLEACSRCCADGEYAAGQDDPWQEFSALLITRGVSYSDVLSVYSNVSVGTGSVELLEPVATTLDATSASSTTTTKIVVLAFGVPATEAPLQFLFEQVHRTVKILSRGRAARSFKLRVCETSKQLRLVLEQEPVVDMLHISGHGNADGSVILLPNAAGARHPVTVGNMLDWLDCVREPRCIFLDFCNSLTMTNSLRGAMASDAVTWIAWATEAMDFPASLFSEGSTKPSACPPPWSMLTCVQPMVVGNVK